MTQRPCKIFVQIVVVSSFLSGVFSSSLYAQKVDSTSAIGKSSVEPLTPVNRSSSDNTNSEHPLTLQPIVRVGVGLLSYIGNVKGGTGASFIQNPSEGRLGYDLGISQPLSPGVEVSLNFLYGNLSEVEQTTAAYWNFQSSIAGGGISALFKPFPKQSVTPYFTIGVESYEFISRADIYNDNGVEYYSWTDGTLRSLPQTSPYAPTAKVLNLDYSYQTDIRGLNLGGSGAYTQQTFAIPVGVGFLLKIATKADFMVGTTLRYTFTNHIDGLTSNVQGALHGTLSNDMFLYTYASLRFNLTRDHPKRPRIHYNESPDFDKSLLEDTVHQSKPGEFDTSLAAIQMQYERFSDTTGRYGMHYQKDSFQWKDPSWIGVGPMPKTNRAVAGNNATSSNNGNPDNNGSNTTPENNGGSPAVANNANPTESNNGTSSANNNANPSGNNNGSSPAANNTNSTEGNNIAPANTVGATGDVVYKVQILSTQNKLAEGITFAGISDKASVDQENGMYKYTTGNFSNYDDAQKYLTQLKGMGYTDAFIRTTQNGKSVRVPEHQNQGVAANNNTSVPVATNTAGSNANSSNQNNSSPANMTGTATGLVFKVQFGAFSNQPSAGFMNTYSRYADGSVVKDEKGLNHYMTGSYNDLQSATTARDKAKAAGVKDVCIKALFNGKFISMSDAMNMLKK